MTDYAELIERLNQLSGPQCIEENGNTVGVIPGEPLCGEAATALETLRRERDEARADARAWSEKSLRYAGEANAQIAKLKAENERLREALEHIAESHDSGRHDGKPEPCPAHDDVSMWVTARQALGESDNG